MIPREYIKVKTRRELTREIEQINQRIEIIEKHVFSAEFMSFPRTPPPRGRDKMPLITRVLELEKGLDLMLEHFGLILFEQPSKKIVSNQKTESE